MRFFYYLFYYLLLFYTCCVTASHLYISQEAGQRIRASKREACGAEQAAALNLDAPEEVGRLLFEDMKLQPPPGAVTVSKRTGRPKYSTKVRPV